MKKYSKSKELMSHPTKQLDLLRLSHGKDGNDQCSAYSFALLKLKPKIENVGRLE